MTQNAVARLNRSFAILLALALASFACALWGGGSTLAVAAILAIVCLKTRLVVFDFMELRHRSGPVRAALIAWPAFFAVAALVRTLLVAV